MHLPNLVWRQARAEGRHQRALPPIDDRLKKSLVAELGRKQVRATRSRRAVANQAFATVGVPSRLNGIGLAKKRIGQRLVGVRHAANMEWAQDREYAEGGGNPDCDQS